MTTSHHNRTKLQKNHTQWQAPQPTKEDLRKAQFHLGMVRHAQNMVTTVAGVDKIIAGKKNIVAVTTKFHPSDHDADYVTQINYLSKESHSIELATYQDWGIVETMPKLLQRNAHLGLTMSLVAGSLSDSVLLPTLLIRMTAWGTLNEDEKDMAHEAGLHIDEQVDDNGITQTTLQYSLKDGEIMTPATVMTMTHLLQPRINSHLEVSQSRVQDEYVTQNHVFMHKVTS